MVSPFGGEHGWRMGRGLVRIVLALGAAALLAGLPELLTLSVGPDADLSGRLGLAGGVGTVTFAVLFLAGVLTSLTPCVYPLIPSRSACSAPARRSTGRARWRSRRPYVGGIA